MPHFELPPSQPLVDITEQLNMRPGERISSVMLRAKMLQREMGYAVQFSFNTEVFTIQPEQTPDSEPSAQDASLPPSDER